MLRPFVRFGRWDCELHFGISFTYSFILDHSYTIGLHFALWILEVGLGQKRPNDDCPLCGQPSWNGEPHLECVQREAMLADMNKTEEQDNG
jgi:hypothetical protein